MSTTPPQALGQFEQWQHEQIQEISGLYKLDPNVVTALIAMESTGNWNLNSRPRVVGRRGKVWPYIGVFQKVLDENWDVLCFDDAFQREQPGSHRWQIHVMCALIILRRVRDHSGVRDAVLHYSGAVDMAPSTMWEDSIVTYVANFNKIMDVLTPPKTPEPA